MKDGYPDLMSDTEKEILRANSAPPGIYSYNAGDVKGRDIPFMERVFRVDFAEHMIGNRLLDVGCGNGRIWKVLSPMFKEIIGIDPNLCWDMPVIPGCRAKKTSLINFSTDLWFDVVLFNESFYLMPDKDIVLLKVLGMTNKVVLVDDAKRTKERIGEATLKTNLYYDIEYLCGLFGLCILADKTYEEIQTRVTVIGRIE